MKLNLVNKIYIGFTVVLVIGIVWKVFKYKPWDRHYFFASVSVPYTHPVYVRDIYFIYPNENNFSEGFYQSRSTVNYFNSYWGAEYDYPRLRETLPFPHQLVLQYVSYRDKKFYRDTLDLPQELIKQTFKEAEEQKKMLLMPKDNGMQEKKALHFVVGIANDGYLMVWLRGMYFEKVLLKTKLKPRDLKPSDLYYAKPMSKDEYYQKVFENMPDTVKQLIGKGIDSKASYIDSPTRYIERNKEYWEYLPKKPSNR